MTYNESPKNIQLVKYLKIPTPGCLHLSNYLSCFLFFLFFLPSLSLFLYFSLSSFFLLPPPFLSSFFFLSFFSSFLSIFFPLFFSWPFLYFFCLLPGNKYVRKVKEAKNASPKASNISENVNMTGAGKRQNVTWGCDCGVSSNKVNSEKISRKN